MEDISGIEVYLEDGFADKLKECHLPFEPLLEETNKQLKELNMRLRQLTSVFNRMERKLK